MNRFVLKNAAAHIVTPLIALAATLLLFLCGCAGAKPAAMQEPAPGEPASLEAPTPEPTSEPTPEPTSEPTPEPTPEPTVVDFRFTEPDGFVPDPENPMKLITSGYPADPSYIAIGVGKRDESAIDYTKESYNQYLTDYYAEAFGRPVQVTVDAFTLKEIDGSPGMRVTYFLDSGDGYWAYILEITAVADRNFQVMFSDSTVNNAWMSDFSLSSRTIDIVWSNEADEPDYSALPLCACDAGLSIRMSAEMKVEKSSDFDMFWTSDDCMMSGLREGFDTLATAGVGGAETTIEEYIAIVESNNGVTFTPDSYGNPAATYITEVDGNSFFNYSTVRRGSDAFWLVSLVCLERQQSAYQPQFEFWANSIKVK